MATASLDDLQRPRIPLVKQKADGLTSFYSVPPIPVVDIAHSLSVRVITDPFDKYRASVAGFCDFAGSKIYVNADDPIVQQTYTVAHELGHWLLHGAYFRDPKNEKKYKPLPRGPKPLPADPLEEEARLFALNLLIPAHMLARLKNSAPLPVLAKMFAVTPETMSQRMRHA